MNCDKIINFALGEITQGVSSISLEDSVESFPSGIIAVVHEVVKLNETDRCYQWCWFTQDHLNALIGHKAHAPWRAKLICFQNGFPLVSFELLVNKVPNINADNLSSKSIAPCAKLRRVKSLISHRSATACITRKTMRKRCRVRLTARANLLDEENRFFAPTSVQWPLE